MLFNSIEFAIFFPIVFIVYWMLNHRWQNRFLLIASYVFYGSWNWKFLFLIWFSTVLDYYCGLCISNNSASEKRRSFLYLSIIGNLGILGIFKYSDFFIAETAKFLNVLGFQANLPVLQIILPVGISFYTFQTLSYTIDIYNKKMEPTRVLTDFALFVAFFPQLVAGPIERARNFIPQLQKPRFFQMETFYQGLHLMLWGLFTKMVIADNAASYVDHVYQSVETFPANVLLFATYLFAFQIYCDFAGYSNIARGVAKMLGFELSINFNLPYLSKNPIEFWQRWHISLSQWLRDYLYIPLGGNRNGFAFQCRNLMVTMALIGLWHGANWTFVFFGVHWGIFIILNHLLKKSYKKMSNVSSDNIIVRIFSPAHPLGNIIKVIITFQIAAVGWIFFRAENVEEAWFILYKIFSSLEFNSTIFISEQIDTAFLLILVSGLMLIELVLYKYGEALQILAAKTWVRYPIYYILITLTYLFHNTLANPFIYFRF